MIRSLICIVTKQKDSLLSNPFSQLAASDDDTADCTLVLSSVIFAQHFLNYPVFTRMSWAGTCWLFFERMSYGFKVTSW